jgi:cytochrome c553
MRALWTIALLCTSVAATAFARAPADHDTRLAHAYFQEFCSSCHGAEGRGDGPTSRAYPNSALDLTRIAERRGNVFDMQQIRELIEKHQGESLLSSASEPEDARVVARHRVALIARHIESLQVRAP